MICIAFSSYFKSNVNISFKNNKWIKTFSQNQANLSQLLKLMSPSLKLIFSLLLQRGMRWPLLPNGNSYTPKRHFYQVMWYQVSVRIASWINSCQMIEIVDNHEDANCKIQWYHIFSIIWLRIQSCMYIDYQCALHQDSLKIFWMDCSGLVLNYWVK